MGLWEIEHVYTIFPAFFIMAVLAYIMRKLLLKKSYEIRMIPIKIIAVILIIIEVFKQIESFDDGYKLFSIPLHFCSMFLYLIPLFAFYRGKGADKIRAFSCAAMLSLFFGMLVLPSIIYGSYYVTHFFTDYFAFHTVFFHNLVIFAFFLVISLDLHKPNKEETDTRIIAFIGMLYTIIAATASHILDTNFSHFLYTTVGFLEKLVDKIRLSIGDTVTTVIYTATLALLHIVLLVLTNYIFRFISRFVDFLAKKSKKQ